MEFTLEVSSSWIKLLTVVIMFYKPKKKKKKQDLVSRTHWEGGCQSSLSLSEPSELMKWMEFKDGVCSGPEGAP